MDKRFESLAEDSELWEKGGQLGEQEEHAQCAGVEHEVALEDALELQLISIRLQKKMIKDLKFIAEAHGIGYQPLIRDILSRFIAHEIKEIIRNSLARRELERKKLETDLKEKTEEMEQYPEHKVA